MGLNQNMKLNRRRTLPASCTQIREQEGVMLVEMLIAILILSIMMATVMQGLSQVSTTSTATQNQVIAANMIQELVDQARNTDWNSLCAAADGVEHQVAVYGNPISGQPAYLPRSLMYTGTTAAGQANQFRGQVMQRVENVDGAFPPTHLRVTVRVTWPAENSGGATRQVVATSYVSQFGIHN